MTDYIDGVIHIADVPALVAFFASNAPDMLDEEGASIIGFARTPVVQKGAAALAYVRVTPEEEAAFASGPGITILARAPYTGPETADAVYVALFDDPEAVALYDQVYDRSPVSLPEGETYTPPARFGVMA